MMLALQSYVQRGNLMLRKLRLDARFHKALRIAGFFLAGFVLSAASLVHRPQPLVLGLLCALSGWPAVLAALGGAAGYMVFWGSAGLQGVVWLIFGLPLGIFSHRFSLPRSSPLLLPSMAALVVSACGVLFQMRFGDTTPIAVYLLRVVLGGASSGLFMVLAHRRDAVFQWLAWGLFALALAQISPFPWLNLGMVAVAAVCVAGPFPATALCALALDLSQICPVSVTAALCLAWLVKLLPRVPKAILCTAPGISYILVMALSNRFAPVALPGLLLGGLLGLRLPGQNLYSHRRGETGIAQVRLEMTAGVFCQVQQLLLEAPETQIDEPALIARAAERACGGCPCRKNCRDRQDIASLPPQLLHKPLLDQHDLPVVCRKPGRLLLELHRSQEQLRAIRADREQQKEYRNAVIQQYRFLSEYLQDLSDMLGRRAEQRFARYRPEVQIYANRAREDNGDRCLHFAGVGCRYYVVICDGMGTGLGAADEGKNAAALLKSLLCAGFPAEYALRSLNSLCALRQRAGAVTVDMAQLQLDTGKVLLYKWGAAPSLLLSAAGAEKIGTAGPPPGLSVTECRETVERLSLRRGQTLMLLSDGVDGEVVQRCCPAAPGGLSGEMAARILEFGTAGNTDDATIALIRLFPDSSYTS